MIGGAAQGAHAPSADADDEPLVGDLDVHDPIHVGDLREGFRLGDGPGKAVEKEAVSAIDDQCYGFRFQSNITLKRSLCLRKRFKVYIPFLIQYRYCRLHDT